MTLSEEELETALKSMKNNKSPGTDGLTVELYKRFLPLLASNFFTACGLQNSDKSHRQETITYHS